MNAELRSFDVVLCSHNGAAFIEEQIASILAQHAQIHAIHVHDFASRDDTRAVLARLSATAGGKLLVTCHDDAPGASQSFIRALRLTLPLLAEDALVFLADQDDVWLPGKVETITAALQARNVTCDMPLLLFHDVKVVDQTLQVMRPTYYTGNPFALPRDLAFARLVLANPAIGHTMLLSRSLIALIVGWPGIERYMMHDWLAVMIASRLGRVEYVPLALSLYRQHQSNILGAYRTHRRASPRRLLQHADRLITQTMAFSHATHAARQQIAAPAPSRLEVWMKGSYRRGAMALGISAIAFGPTWQRKAIGGLLLLRALIGPAPTSVESGA